jgi:cysteinyl-tRNA synthetase
MKIHNTMTKHLEEFVPLDGNHVRMYTCGPTVYDFAHIGNFRSYMFEDLLRRYLKYRGYKVTQVMNLTDVDDKTIKGASAAGTSLNDYTKKFKDAFFADLKTLNIEPAEHYPAATDYIAPMIVLIQRLFDKGVAYKSDDGSVYFSIAKFPDYGKLAHLDKSGLRAGARVAQDEYEKENLADFALWKAWDEKDGAVGWDSPWGKGRPGWHIECSAMSMKLLGETFDLHTGGIDNIFPHHEDEIAQSEAATGKPFVKYWMHCAHLVVDGRKMSKSLGNFYTLRDIVNRGYSGREIRYILMAAHYRQSLNFTFEALDGARASLKRLDDFVDRLKEESLSETIGGTLPAWAGRGHTRFVEAMEDDLNISGALAALFDMVRDGNTAIDSGHPMGSLRAVVDLILDLDRVLGLFEKPEDKPDSEVLRLADEREKARKAKNWSESDRLRKALADKGWEVRDTAEGPKLKKK